MNRSAGLIQRQYAEEQTKCAQAGSYIPPTTRQQLQQQKEMLEHQLDQVNAAIRALDTNPNLEEFIETLKKAGV